MPEYTFKHLIHTYREDRILSANETQLEVKNKKQWHDRGTADKNNDDVGHELDPNLQLYMVMVRMLHRCSV